jgi:micrococcal nuclease
VTLKYDEKRIDPHGRTLAAIFIADGTLVNAEIARQGLGAVVVIGGNDRFYPPVEEARDEAVVAERGLYSADVVCTVPAKVRAVTNAADSFPGVDVQATSTQLDTGASTAAAAVATAIGLEEAFTDGSLGVAWSALPDPEQERLADLLTAGKIKAQRDELAARTAATSAREREEVARAAEVRRQREARERAAQEKRERQAARAAEKAAEQARQVEVAAAKARTQQSDSSSPGGSSGPAGYTGPRCYAPGGKTWRPC